MPLAKIFIVEDEAIIALDIKKTLEKMNYEVAGVSDRGEGALKMIDKLYPDVILMDIVLKGELDGIETARLINLKRKIPIIYLTAHHDDDTLERSKSTNPYGYLLKPLNDRDLNACLRMALSRIEYENKLKDSEEVLSRANKINTILFNSIPGLVLVINSKGIVTAINNKSGEVQFKISHFLNNDIKKIFSGKTGNKFEDLIELTIDTGVEQILEHIIKVNEHKYIYETKFIKYSDSEVLAVFKVKTSGEDYQKALEESEYKYKNLIKNSPVAITRLLIKTNRYEFVNDEFVKQSGYTLEEFNALSNEEYEKMIYPADRVELRKEYSKWIKSGAGDVKNLVYRITNTNKEIIWLDSYHYADRSPNGEIIAVNQIYLNINKQKQDEEVLSESKQYLDAFFSQSLDGIFIAKIETPVKYDKNKLTDKQLEHIIRNVKITRANKPLAEQFGISTDEILNIDAKSYYGANFKDAKKRWKELLSEGHSHVKEYFQRPDGSKIYIEGDYYCLYDNENNFTGYLGIRKDMTERKSADELIRLSEEKFRAVAESMPAQVVIFQDKRFVYANPYSEIITGYKTQELLNMNFWDIIHEDYKEIAKDRGQKRLLGENVPDNYDLKIITKNKEEKWLNYNASIIEFNGKKAVLGIATDITESKKNQDKIRLSEQRYRTFIEHSSEGIFRAEFYNPIPVNLPIDEQIGLIFRDIYYAEVNECMAKIYGFKSVKEFVGKKVSELMPESDPYNVEFMKTFIKNGYRLNESVSKEIDLLGNTIYISNNVVGMVENGFLIRVWGVQRDITDKKKSEEALKRSLKEKEILLKEIHHRVKNNLQIVTSLLKLQAGYVSDEKVKQLFRESQNRVHSMSLIHQKLYQTKDIAHIDFKEYIETVTTHIQHSYGILEDRVKIKTEVSNMVMSIDNAIPAGLIINELVSNSLKHAFPDGRCGNIFINAAFDEFNNEYWLLIRDDGIGMNEIPDIERSSSFGLKLVYTLVQQLDGIIEIVTKGGSEFRIQFKSAVYKERNI